MGDYLGVIVWGTKGGGNCPGRNLKRGNCPGGSYPGGIVIKPTKSYSY